jgi:hypothetical protein
MEDEWRKAYQVGPGGVLDLSPREKGWLARRTSKDDKINFEYLARFLSCPEGQKVVELNLQGCGISDQSLQILAPAVARHANMRRLNLKSNDFKPASLFIFISLLMEINTTLVDLQIDELKDKPALLLAPGAALGDKDEKVVRQQINPLVNAFNTFNSTLSRVSTTPLHHWDLFLSLKIFFFCFVASFRSVSRSNNHRCDWYSNKPSKRLNEPLNSLPLLQMSNERCKQSRERFPRKFSRTSLIGSSRIWSTWRLKAGDTNFLLKSSSYLPYRFRISAYGSVACCKILTLEFFFFRSRWR